MFLCTYMYINMMKCMLYMQVLHTFCTCVCVGGCERERERESLHVCNHSCRRVVFVAFHKSVAVLILLCSCESYIVRVLSLDHMTVMWHLFPSSPTHTIRPGVALFMGTYMFCNPVMTWTMAILGLSILTNLGFILLLEILTRTHKCKLRTCNLSCVIVWLFCVSETSWKPQQWEFTIILYHQFVNTKVIYCYIMGDVCVCVCVCVCARARACACACVHACVHAWERKRVCTHFSCIF